jgi:chromate transporter
MSMTENPVEGCAAALVERVSLASLFLSFLLVSMCGFGGGLVWARRMAVDKRGWLSEAEFADTLSFCQFLPGPNIASVTLCVGHRLRGPAGAAAALAGFILVPWSVGFGLGALWLHFADLAVLQGILAGVSAAAAGLLIATGLRLLAPQRRRPAALVFAALAFAGLVFVKLPLLVVVFGLAPLSIAAARFESAAR